MNARFTEVQRTAKGIQLEATSNGMKFWIMAKWLREDGTLTPKGIEALEKAEAGVDTMQEYQKSKKFVLKAKSARHVTTKYGEKLVAECYDGSTLWLNPEKAFINLLGEVMIEYSYAQWLKKENKQGWTQIKGL